MANILFVSNDFPPNEGGIATFNYHICKELYSLGHKVVVIANRCSRSKCFDKSQNEEPKRSGRDRRSKSGDSRKRNFDDRDFGSNKSNDIDQLKKLAKKISGMDASDPFIRAYAVMDQNQRVQYFYLLASCGWDIGQFIGITIKRMIRCFNQDLEEDEG